MKKRRNYIKEANQAVKSGNWMVRTDNNGVSANPYANGFKWRKKGLWNEAPDWNETPSCGGGLHGQSKDAGGFKTDGKRVVFCKTKGKKIIISDDKIKVQKAMILMINKLPKNLRFNKSLDLSNSHIKELPEGLHVGGSRYLRGTEIKELP